MQRQRMRLLLLGALVIMVAWCMFAWRYLQPRKRVVYWLRKCGVDDTCMTDSRLEYSGDVDSEWLLEAPPGEKGKGCAIEYPAVDKKWLPWVDIEPCPGEHRGLQHGLGTASFSELQILSAANGNFTSIGPATVELNPSAHYRVFAKCATTPVISYHAQLTNRLPGIAWATMQQAVGRRHAFVSRVNSSLPVIYVKCADAVDILFNPISMTIQQPPSCVSPAPQQPAVIMLLIDSLSRVQFLRSMPKSASFLQSLSSSTPTSPGQPSGKQTESPVPGHQRVQSFLFDRYNIVGDHSAPNMAALFAHLSWDDLYGKGMKEEVHTVKWLWDLAHEAGFVSSVGLEDCVTMGGHKTFSFARAHVKNPPMFCPNSLIPNLFQLMHPERPLCVHNRRAAELLLEHAMLFRRVHGTAVGRQGNRPSACSHPTFSLVIVNEPHQPPTTGSLQLDQPLLDFLHYLYPEHPASDAPPPPVLFLLSDHGSFQEGYSQTRAGQLEALLPVFATVWPRDLLQRWPGAAQALSHNRHRVFTGYDVFRTVRHTFALLRNMTSPAGGPVEEGTPDELALPQVATTSLHSQSLLRELPARRSCDDVGVPGWFCACMQWKLVHRHAALDAAERIPLDMLYRGNADNNATWALTHRLAHRSLVRQVRHFVHKLDKLLLTRRNDSTDAQCEVHFARSNDTVAGAAGGGDGGANQYARWVLGQVQVQPWYEAAIHHSHNVGNNFKDYGHGYIKGSLYRVVFAVPFTTTDARAAKFPGGKGAFWFSLIAAQDDGNAANSRVGRREAPRSKLLSVKVESFELPCRIDMVRLVRYNLNPKPPH